VVRAVDSDRIFIQSIPPTENHNSHHRTTIARETQLASDLRHHLHAHYRQYRKALENSE
jgi:hypothetical protein